MLEDFEKWCDEIDSFAQKTWPEQSSYTKDTGRENWLDAYGDGLTPEEAWEEELAAMRDML